MSSHWLLAVHTEMIAEPSEGIVQQGSGILIPTPPFLIVTMQFSLKFMKEIYHQMPSQLGLFNFFYVLNIYAIADVGKYDVFSDLGVSFRQAFIEKAGS